MAKEQSLRDLLESEKQEKKQLEQELKLKF